MPDRNELSDLNLNEFSICFEDLGGPANEDCNIEFVKSMDGLGPALKETDMSEHNDDHIENDAEVDADFQAFAESDDAKGFLEEFSGLSEDDQVGALLGMAYDNVVQEAAIGDAAAVIKSLTENTVPKDKYEELKKSAAAAVTLIEKMKSEGKVGDADAGPLSELRKSLTAGGAALSEEAEARISEVEKSLAKQAQAEAIAKAKTYGFGKAEDVADLETRIRKALGDKAADLYAAQIKQAGEIAKKSPLFKSIGEDTGADPTPVTKAQAVIEEIKKANPTFTDQQAFAKAIEQNPGLYRELDAARVAA